ncbi:hypothetical protein HZ994_01555 [Akkermansiaceae bacterium]|nr:hypothetical protein HZ994_01555 [Akkermansiaceae bacterium]
MKYKISVSILGGAILFGAVSCKEKPKTADAPETAKSVAEKVVKAVEEAVAPKMKKSLTAEERAAKLGFAKFLPKDTEMVMSVYDARKAGDQLKALKLYGLLQSEIGMGVDGFEQEMLDEVVPEDDLLEDGEQDEFEEFDGGEMGEAPSPWLLLGQEVTFALGDTGSEQAARMMKFSSRMTYFQARAMGKAAQAYAKTGDMQDFTDSLQSEMGGDMMKNLLSDPESGIALIDKAEMPPFYIAMRAKEGELEQAAQMVNSGMGIFGMAEGMAEPVEIETGGAKFMGYKLLGAKIAELMEEGKEGMAESMGEDNATALISAISRKNIVVVTGTVADYVVVMIGGSETSLKLASGIEESIVAGDELSFADDYADKQFVSVIYGANEVWEEIMDDAGVFATYALGIRDGISGGGGMGDTRDLEAMLQIVADREKAMLGLCSSETLGMVAFVDEGLKIESIGGYDQGAVDWDAKTSLAHLGDSGDNMLFLNIPSNAAYDEQMGDYLEAIVETLYAATVKFSELEIDAPELAQVKESMKLFDGQFRADFVGLYGALGNLSDGLGHETAVVMDLKGSMPAIPGFPQAFVDEAKAPRFTMISPVADRGKIKESWKEMDTRMTSLLAKVSEMTNEKIPMQKPISSEKDGMTTWFFSMPFFQDDFMPSVTVSDEWFCMSTSKTQAQDLMIKAADGGAAGNGAVLRVNFRALVDYADGMLAVLDKNSAEIFTGEGERESFKSEMEDMRKFIDACRDFDSMSWRIRKEGGSVRGSVHFKVN